MASARKTGERAAETVDRRRERGLSPSSAAAEAMAESTAWTTTSNSAKGGPMRIRGAGPGWKETQASPPTVT